MLACLRGILFDWQTLIAAAVALIAALWTIRVMNKQARDEQARHDDALYRKSLAARAQMPDALSSLSRFTEACVHWFDGGGTEPDRPDDAINALKNAIEYVDSSAAEPLFELIAFYQVHNSRLFSPHSLRVGPEAADRLFDTARLRCMIDRLFSYARNEVHKVSEIKPTQKDMKEALNLATPIGYASLYKERYDRVLELIAKRYV